MFPHTTVCMASYTRTINVQWSQLMNIPSAVANNSSITMTVSVPNYMISSSLTYIIARRSLSTISSIPLCGSVLRLSSRRVSRGPGDVTKTISVSAIHETWRALEPHAKTLSFARRSQPQAPCARTPPLCQGWRSNSILPITWHESVRPQSSLGSNLLARRYSDSRQEMQFIDTRTESFVVNDTIKTPCTPRCILANHCG